VSNRIRYDISIWEKIISIVSLKTAQLVEEINKEISKDTSLVEFQGKDPVSWQLEEIVEQRANAWVQRVYEICRDAYKSHGDAPSADFDRAMWAYCINPFILGEKDTQIHDMDQDEKDAQIHDKTISGLLNLLLCAVGPPPERRALLTVSQKQCCIDVRNKIRDTWWDRLHLGQGIWEAVEMSCDDGMEARAVRIVRGLPMPATQEKASQSRSQQRPRQPGSPPAESSETRTVADGQVAGTRVAAYRSEVKRFIAYQLLKNPAKTDLEICRALDADGGLDLPNPWKNTPQDRLFKDAYLDPRRRNKVAVAISKVRRDLRKLGVLPAR
jgi:hypothetical protein